MAISGATSSTYVVQGGDFGHELRVEVTAVASTFVLHSA